jgi:hypothetical protein
MIRRLAMAAAACALGIAGVVASTAPAGAASAGVTTPYIASVAIATTPDGGGYWLVGVDGGVFSFGNAAFYGSLPGQHIAVTDIVDIAATPTGRGYWLLGADGGVFSFGDARFYGSIPGVLGRPAPNLATTIVPTAGGGGYWVVASDGGVFTFGNARYFGSLPGLNIAPTAARVTQSETLFAYVASSGVFLQPTPGDNGYWLADSTGNVYSFGNAQFHGSLLSQLNASDIGIGHPTTVPITGFVATPDGGGYLMAGTNGNIYTFGDAAAHGSLSSAGIIVPPISITGYSRPSTVSVSIPLSTVSDMALAPGGNGYLLSSYDGGVFTFGSAQFHGSVPGIPSFIRAFGP